MTREEVEQIIALGEGLHVEFKRSFDKQHSKTLTAMANAQGVTILYGVEDDGTVTGYTLTNSLRAKIERLARDCDPSVPISTDTVDLGQQSVTIVHVDPSDQAPHKCTYGYYLRVGSEFVKMTTEQLVAYINSRGMIAFDDHVRTDLMWTDVLDTKKNSEV